MRNSRDGRQLILNRGSPVRAYITVPLKWVVLGGVLGIAHPKSVVLNEYATTVYDNLLNITRRSEKPNEHQTVLTTV
jgi:hypothetical protein